MADLFPAMTSNTTPSGVVSDLGFGPPGYEYRPLDDDDATGAYLDAFSSAPTVHNFLCYQFPTGYIVEQYTVRYSGFTGWLFQGSNDGSTWTTLDTQASAPPNGVAIPVTNATAYTYYRLYDCVCASRSYIHEWQVWTGPHTAVQPTSVASVEAIGLPYVVRGTAPPVGVEALPMPTFRPELLSLGVGPLVGGSPATPNPTLDVTDIAEGLQWDATTRGGLGGLSFTARQPQGSRSTKQSTNLCPDPEGTDTVWWPS